ATSALGGEMLVCPASNDILRQQSSTRDLSFLPPGNDLLTQFDEAPHLPRCEAPKHEKRGPVEVTTDEYGEMFEVKDQAGTTYTKNSDGKWTKHYKDADPKSDDVVDNFNVGSDGKITYDYNNNDKNVHVHFEHNADGSFSYTNEFGKFVYDKDMQLVEAPAGEGRVRKFHYTNGQLDQIDGVLGHWDRVQKDGQTSWVNKDSGAVWNGDFRLNIDILEYRGQDGAAWGFTPWGTDVNRAGQDK
ncbi:MAG TPA: hypothetical protein V6C72_00620, partial [Chroococcales cyanobacterium]